MNASSSSALTSASIPQPHSSHLLSSTDVHHSSTSSQSPPLLHSLSVAVTTPQPSPPRPNLHRAAALPFNRTSTVPPSSLADTSATLLLSRHLRRRLRSVHMDSVEQKKADEKLIRIVEEQLKEKEQALKKMHDLKRQQDAKQQLETEIDGLKVKLEVGKLLGNEDDTALQGQIKNMNDELEAKMKEMEVMNQTRA
ncbi:hypothetical protein HanPI659440_Chr04g0144381 [Helianthus annuus]|nr:hypothetical protein HanPI659440_Chr04g0144381 [Helianthus annuus]